ncbi:hypothetical protein AALP_AA1G005200 [Arabis alpina]|uniref:Myb-like domain-containing protein n=1 Tax=Arabis alpina TaxID=50452 RepID=A0A087HK69_ARAAL|nr:hypothetical protein AALP_AA1G005200 [Arabis alpina]
MIRSKSFPVYQSRNPIEHFEEERFGSQVSDVEIVVPVPHKKRDYLVTGSEMLLDNSDKCVSGCSEIDCFHSFHLECLDAKLGSSSEEEEEDVANPSCPYCCFNTLALREYESLSGDDYNAYSDSDTDEDQTRVNTSLSGHDDNGYSLETTEIDQELQVEENDREEYNTGAIDSEISSTNEPTGEDVTQVAKSKTVRDISFSNKDQTRRILCTSEEEKMLKDERFGSGVSTTDCDSDVESVVPPVTTYDERFGSGVSITHCDSDVEIVLPVSTFDERDVPHKKRSRGTEMLNNSDACLVCETSDKCVSHCSGTDCLLSFHVECLKDLLGDNSDEDLANSYCPYCWFTILAQREKAVVEEEKGFFNYLYSEMICRDEVEESVTKSQEDPSLSGDDENEYSVATTEIVTEQELQGDEDTSLSGVVNGYSVDTTEIVSDQELQQDEDTSLSGHDNGFSVDTTEIVSDQYLQEDEDDACSSKGEQVQVDKDTSLSGDDNGYSVATTEILSDQELQGEKDSSLSGHDNGHSVDTTEIVSDQELQGDEDDACSATGEQAQVDKDSNESNMTLVEENDTEEEYYNTWKLHVIDEVEVLDDETAQDQASVNATLYGGENGYSVDTTEITSVQELQLDQTRVNRKKGGGSGKENDQVQQNENRIRREIRRRIALEVIDSEVSSNESTNEPIGEIVNEQITQVVKSKTVRDISFFNKDQRRRILWTSEEEDMLTAGVEKFAAEANRNMPWRKILEMGKHVFHETRNPASLKDKWRNMIGAR